jgi:hypothetical protein
MSELIACSVAILAFVAVWLAVYRFGSLNWATDASLAGVRQQLSTERLALDGEVHGAAERLASVPAARRTRRGSTPLIDVLARHARLSVPA